MKKILFTISLLLLAGIMFGGKAGAFDWTQAESGRNNVRLEGWNEQPGYIRFEDGNGTHTGRLFAHGNHLYWYYGGTDTSNIVDACAAGSCEKISVY